jgi:hypothetical protein
MGPAQASVGRRRARLLGVAVGVSLYASLALLDFVGSLHEQECKAQALGPLAAMCARGFVFFVLAVYGTPVLVVVAGVLALPRRTRPFAGGLGIGVIVGVLAGVGWLRILSD